MLPPGLLRQPLASTGIKKRSAFVRRFFRHDRRAFTLVEMLVSIVALTAFVLMVSRLVNSASTITTIGNKHMDVDSQARSVLGRMAIHFSQMVKRTDVDYFLKGAAGGTMTGNDQIAFYSRVEGYYSTNSQSHLSLVGYRVNSDLTSASYNKLERLGKGLAWNGYSSGNIPIVFSPLTIAGTWPSATTSNGVDLDYELIGPQVFRVEYYYLLKGQTVGGTTYLSILSLTPWDTRITGHTALNAFQDVSAIGVTIAVIDPQSRVLVLEDNAHLGKLIADMLDFSLNMHSGGTSTATQPGDLDALWQSKVNAPTAVPRAAASAIRIYSRLFPIAR